MKLLLQQSRYSTIFAALVLAALAVSSSAEQVPQQSWDDLARYPGEGLSPLYRPAGERCLQILDSRSRWEVLPRPIRAVLASPEERPCFEMHNGDYYYNNLFGNAEAVRWAAEQTWQGRFRLLYNTDAVARHRDELWLVVDGFSPPLGFLHGHEWTRYKPVGSVKPPAAWANCYLARDASGAWWIASQQGLYRLEDGQWHLPKIPGWPGGAAKGIVADDQGRLVAWAGQPDGSAVAFFRQGRWDWIEVPLPPAWTAAAIRPDGTVVLAGSRRIVRIDPRAVRRHRMGSPDPAGALPELEHVEQGRFQLQDGQWVQVLGTPAVGRNGSALFAARRLSDQQGGLVRLPADGPPEWKPVEALSETQIINWREGFLLLVQGAGLWKWEPGDEQPLQIGCAGEVGPDDRLLAADADGRAYLARGKAIRAFLPDGEAAAGIRPARIASIPPPSADTTGSDDRDPSRLAWSIPVAVDSEQNCWFIAAQDGWVHVLAKDDPEAQLRDDRLVGATSLWPGRQGSMLILLENGRAALACDQRRVVFGDSLLDLARNHFAAMREAAPQSTRDPRRPLEPDGPWRPMGTPWLTTGDRLWVIDGGQVHRIGATAPCRAGGCAKPAVDATRVWQGPCLLVGPLSSGDLLLAVCENRSSWQLTEWQWIEDPEGEARVVPVQAPPKQTSAGSLSTPASISGPWLLDSSGGLWLHESFDRVWRIATPGAWEMAKDFGKPQLEHPPQSIWAYHSARVFPGYEVAAPESRRSCVATYLEHLTPLYGVEEQVVCLTPDGMALLRLGRGEAPTEDMIAERFHVAWKRPPAWFLGHSSHRAYFIVESETGSALVAVNLECSGR